MLLIPSTQISFFSEYALTGRKYSFRASSEESEWSDFEARLCLDLTIEWTSAPISLLMHNPDFLCVIKLKLN